MCLEIVASQWGNSRAGARVVHVDRKEMYVEAEGVFHDLETNTATTSRVRRRISDRNGRVFNDDMIIVTGNAACSIAKRNAILGGVPEAIWGEAYDAALRTVRGDMETLPERRDKTLKAMAAFGLTADQVYQILGIGGEKDFGLDQIATLRSSYFALKNGETTVEELLKTIERPDAIRKAGSITRDTTPKIKDHEESNPSEEKDAQALQIEQLRGVYRDLTGEAPSGRWGIPALTENIDKAKAAKLQRDGDERDGAEAERDHLQVSPHDADTGEVSGSTTGNEVEPDLTKFQNLYNTIVNDLIDAASPDDVVELYEPQIEQMKKVTPDLHNQLMAEIEAAKE